MYFKLSPAERRQFVLASIPWIILINMTSSNGNIFRVTGYLWWEFTGHRWIPRTKASEAELWFFDLRLNKRLNEQSRGMWFEMPLRRLWRHCNVSGGTILMLGWLVVRWDLLVAKPGRVPPSVKVMDLYGWITWSVLDMSHNWLTVAATNGGTITVCIVRMLE